MQGTFTYWTDRLESVRRLTAGCCLAGIEGSDDPEDGLPFTGVFIPYAETVEENDGRDFAVRVEWRGDPELFLAEF